MGKVGGSLRLIRPVNCFMMGVAVIVGAALASPSSLGQYWPPLFYGFVTSFTLTAASMAINDYYDREIDAINEPKRPIPSGQIRPKEALALATVFSLIGFIAACLTNAFSLATAIIAYLVFVTYTTIGKRSGLPGNFLVSACVAIPFIYGSITIVDESRLNVLFFASMAFLSNTGREVTKGIVDIQGDKTRNVKTLAARFGERSAAFGAAFFYVLAVLLSPVPWFLNLVSVWFIPFVLVTDIGFVVSSVLLVKNHSRESARKIKNMVLICFLFGLLAFIAGTLG